jgi:predicted 2-oxoglutarate/Fe(II)-dependent dioxygenase YbiX
MTLTDFILVTGPLLDPLTCREILAVTEGVEWRVPVSGDGYPQRTCTTFPLSAAVGGNYRFDPNNWPLAKRADDILLDATQRGLAVYKAKHPMVTRADSGFDILKYEPGQLIASHVDDLMPRVLSMSIGLNDDYDGGEFQFWDEPPFRLPGGSALMFPPNFMYPHQVLPVTRGVRYSMVTWFL